MARCGLGEKERWAGVIFGAYLCYSARTYPKCLGLSIGDLYPLFSLRMNTGVPFAQALKCFRGVLIAGSPSHAVVGDRPVAAILLLPRFRVMPFDNVCAGKRLSFPNFCVVGAWIHSRFFRVVCIPALSFLLELDGQCPPTKASRVLAFPLRDT